MRTWAEPRLSADASTVDVSPGQLAQTLSQAQPGQILRFQGFQPFSQDRVDTLLQLGLVKGRRPAEAHKLQRPTA